MQNLIGKVLSKYKYYIYVYNLHRSMYNKYLCIYEQIKHTYVNIRQKRLKVKNLCSSGTVYPLLVTLYHQKITVMLLACLLVL